MIKFLTLFIGASTFLFGCSHSKEVHHGHHRFQDAEKWAKVFEDRKRDSWQEPFKVIKALGVKSNSIVADIGAATGYFPVRIAKIAREGRVWGVDIEPDMVRFLNTRARKEKINNLYSILGTENQSLIPEKVDFILIVNSYHHISNRVEYLSRLIPSLNKKGKLVIIDFRKGDLPIGPRDPMKISAAKIIEEVKKAGFSLSKNHDFLKYQNFLVFSTK